MKNKERYTKDIVDIACGGHVLAVSKKTGKPVPCDITSCSQCVFSEGVHSSCVDNGKEWAESEYVEVGDKC